MTPFIDTRQRWKTNERNDDRDQQLNDVITMKSLRKHLQESIPEEEAFSNAKTFGDPAIRQGTWLTTALWNDFAWGLKLKDAGVGWPEFMRAYGQTQRSFLEWKRGETEWEAAMDDLIDAVLRIR